jgi:drug/metabolite transporter (DMT)-like permease
LACLGAALSYGFANTFGRRFKRMGIEPSVGAFGQVTATACMALPLALLIDKPWQLGMPGLATWGALIGLALLSTALAYIIFFRLIATAGATNTSLVTLLIPVSAVLLGATFLGERLSSLQVSGMALIGLGLIVLDGRLFRR